MTCAPLQVEQDRSFLIKHLNLVHAEKSSIQTDIRQTREEKILMDKRLQHNLVVN